MAARQRGQFMVVGSDCDGFDRKSDALRIRRLCTGFRRRALDDSGGAGRGGSRGCVDSGPVRTLPLAAATHVCREDAFRHATEIWRARGIRGSEEKKRIAFSSIFQGFESWLNWRKNLLRL